jgi:type VI protein secretion system component VasA
MNQLLPYFEREMGILRRNFQEMIRLTVDEAAFTHRSIYVFAQALDYVLGYCMSMSNFSRPIVQAADGRELVLCAQRPGGQSPA